MRYGIGRMRKFNITKRFLKIWAHFLLRKKPGFAGVPTQYRAASGPVLRPLRAPPIPCAVAPPIGGGLDPSVEFCNAKLRKQLPQCDYSSNSRRQSPITVRRICGQTPVRVWTEVSVEFCAERKIPEDNPQSPFGGFAAAMRQLLNCRGER
jgi:hypothetical protein